MDIDCQHLDYSWKPEAECYECDNPSCRILLEKLLNYPANICWCGEAIDNHRLTFEGHSMQSEVSLRKHIAA